MTSARRPSKHDQHLLRIDSPGKFQCKQVLKHETEYEELEPTAAAAIAQPGTPPPRSRVSGAERQVTTDTTGDDRDVREYVDNLEDELGAKIAEVEALQEAFNRIHTPHKPAIPAEEQAITDQIYDEAEAKEKSQDWTGAKEQFQEVLRRDPEYQLARDHLATIAVNIAREGARRRQLHLPMDATDHDCKTAEQRRDTVHLLHSATDEQCAEHERRREAVGLPNSATLATLEAEEAQRAFCGVRLGPCTYRCKQFWLQVFTFGVFVGKVGPCVLGYGLIMQQACNYIPDEYVGLYTTSLCS